MTKKKILISLELFHAVIRMSYINAGQKIKELEKIGYLNKGDDSVRYLTSNTNFIYRFFNDNMSKEGARYLKQKLEEFLIKEKVMFQIGYSMAVIPHETLVKKISQANSYADMAFDVEKLDFIKVQRTTDEYMEFKFITNKVGRKDVYFDAEALQYALPDGITAENIKNSNRIRITSDRCTIDNEKKEIDKMFEEI